MSWNKLRELDAALPVPLWVWRLAYLIIYAFVGLVALATAGAALLFLFI